MPVSRNVRVLAAGLLAAFLSTGLSAAAPQGGFAPGGRTLDANLYMQTSAEYQAVCLQTYNWAAERLRSRLAAREDNGRRPAVVMDLDETVFDNGGYQSFREREGLQFSDITWGVWEREFAREVRLVPGAGEFIARAERSGVSVVYISNRRAEHRDRTIEVLQRLGLGLDGIETRLMLRTDSSDKSERRRTAEARFHVLMYVGDNLRDFSEEFAAPSPLPRTASGLAEAIERRSERVRQAASHWGVDWIVLPNPAYGEWQRLLPPDPYQSLRATEMKVPAAEFQTAEGSGIGEAILIQLPDGPPRTGGRDRR